LIQSDCLHLARSPLPAPDSKILEPIILAEFIISHISHCNFFKFENIETITSLVTTVLEVDTITSVSLVASFFTGFTTVVISLLMLGSEGFFYCALPQV
jgi:hypothetical protein